MSSLQVRELPENIYSLLKRRAEAERRSIAQEAIALLAKGLNTSIFLKSVVPSCCKKLLKSLD